MSGARRSRLPPGARQPGRARARRRRSPRCCGWSPSPRWRCSPRAHWVALVDVPAGRAHAARRRWSRPRPARALAALGRGRLPRLRRAASSAAAVLAACSGSRSRWPRPACRCGCSSRATGTSSATGSTAGWRWCGTHRLALRRARTLGAAHDPARRAAARRCGRARLLPGARAGRAAAARRSALVALLGAYGTAVTEHDPGAPLLRGLALLVLVGAWLWLPRLRGRARRWPARRWCSRWARCRCRSPPRSTRSEPWSTTARGTGSGAARTVTFDWTHRYGPLDWPRDGTTLLNVKSDAAALLEGGDARPLRRPALGARRDERRGAGAGRPSPAVADGHWNYFEWNRKWDEELRFTVRSLSSDLLVVGGHALRDRGRRAGLDRGGRHRPSSPTAAHAGDSYTVTTYVPDPTAAQMRGAPGLPAELADPVHARSALPAAGRERARCRRRRSRPGGRTCRSGRPTTATRRRRGARSRRRAYARMYGLAPQRDRRRADDVRRGAGASSATSTRNFSYSEKPRAAPLPARRVPVPRQVRLLPAVLGRDGADAAHGRHPRARGGRLRARLAQPRHGRVPGARPRRPLVGRGVVQRHRLGHVRPDARRWRRRSRSRADAAARPAPAAGRSTARARALAAPDRAQPASAAARRRPTGGGACRPWLLLLLGCSLGGGGARGLAGRRAGARRLGRRDAGRGAAGGAAPRAARGSAGSVPAGTTLLGARAAPRARGRPGGGPLRGRAARAPLRPARAATRPTPARAPRACAATSPPAADCAAGCSGCSRSRRAARARSEPVLDGSKERRLHRCHEP